MINAHFATDLRQQFSIRPIARVLKGIQIGRNKGRFTRFLPPCLAGKEACAYFVMFLT